MGSYPCSYPGDRFWELIRIAAPLRAEGAASILLGPMVQGGARYPGISSSLSAWAPPWNASFSVPPSQFTWRLSPAPASPLPPTASHYPCLIFSRAFIIPESLCLIGGVTPCGRPWNGIQGGGDGPRCCSSAWAAGTVPGPGGAEQTMGVQRCSLHPT